MKHALAANQWLRRAAVTALVIALATAITAVVSLEIQHTHDDAALRSAHKAIERSTTAVQVAQAALTQVERTLAAQHLALVEGCQRLNILRRQDNLAHLGSFIVFEFVLHSAAQSQQPHLTRVQRRLARVFYAKLGLAVGDETWTPITNCTQAVNLHGVRYRPPQPIPFTHALPPRSALP